VLLARDGTERPIDDRAAPIRGDNGQTVGVVLTFRDVTQQRQAQEALRLAQEQLQIVTNSMSAAVARCGRDLTYLWVSKPYADWLGRSPDEIVGHPITEVIGHEAFEALRPSFERVLAGQQVRYEEEVNFRGLGRRWINAVDTPTLDAASVPDGWVAVVLDITERRHMEEALRQGEERFARFMHSLPGLAWIKDLQGRYVYANDAALKVFRRSREGLYGKTDAEVFPPGTAAQFEENDRQALASGVGVQVVETLEHENGLVHHSLVNKFPILGPGGSPAFVGGMAIDITDRLRAEEVLAESQQRFRQLAENVNEVFWMTDPQTTQLLYISPAYERVWGRSCQSLYENPRSFLDAIHPEDRERVRIAVLGKQSRGEATDEEYRVVRPDGSVRWVRDRAFPVRDAGGRVYRLAGIAEDITEKKQADQELRRQEADLRIARVIQQGLLPKARPGVAGLQIAGRLATAEQVGGDCFDFVPLPGEDRGSLGVFVADASGHGLGSALLMAQAHAYLRALSLTCADVGTLLTLANRRLTEHIDSDLFVTVLFVRLDLHNRYLVYAGAGHCPGYILDRQGRAKAVLASTGCPLGVNPASEFPTGPPATLEPGELVLLFTDGIVEAAASAGGQFGLERTLGIVRAHQREAPEAILDALFGAVGDFSGQQLRDDITAVIIKAEGIT
jgi:PAS domain S-box-containing protein